MLVHRITLDVDHPERSPNIDIKKGDKQVHRFEFSIVQDGKSVISDVYGYDFKATKPDGTTIFDHCTLEGGKVVYTLSGQATTCIGSVEAEISVFDDGDLFFTTPTFFIHVLDVAFDEKGDISKDDLEGFRQYMKRAEKAAASAEGSAGAARASESNAEESANIAMEFARLTESERELAAQSAREASTKANEASVSAQTASTKASEAATSAQTSSTKASEAAESAASAATSAEIAEESATMAGNYASGANISAQTASAKASEASASAARAEESATESGAHDVSAAKSATEAEASAQTASTKANEASVSAKTASTKASEAATSANTASTKASEAAESAASAATSAESAEESATMAGNYASGANRSAQTASAKASEASASAASAEESATASAERATEAKTYAEKAQGAASGYSNGTGGISVGNGLVAEDYKDNTVYLDTTLTADASVEQVNCDGSAYYGVYVTIPGNTFSSGQVGNWVRDICNMETYEVNGLDLTTVPVFEGVFINSSTELILCASNDSFLDGSVANQPVNIYIAYESEPYKPNQTIFGEYNAYKTRYGTKEKPIFAVGCGISDASRANAMRLTRAGLMYLRNGGSYQSSGADFAEFREWSDGNPENEDRRGYVVTRDEKNPKMIRKANAGDFVHGVVSSKPCLVGNADEEWHGKYLTDDFGSILYEEVEIDGKVISQPKINPEYDDTQVYVPREERKEWDFVALKGEVPARDDGTCIPGCFCKHTDGGIMTACEMENGCFRVVDRINEYLIIIDI